MTIKTIIEGLENLKCVNGAMYLGAVETPCSGRETGECCQNEQTYKEAVDELHTYLRSQLSTLLDEIEKENQELIGRHNARILNQFQLEMKPDMPLIAYDERVALIPAITKIAEETKKDILSTLNKYKK